MELTEKEIEDYIFNAAQTVEGQRALQERGLGVWGKMFRQVNLGSCGRLDLISVGAPPRGSSMNRTDSTGICITVYELKRDIIDMRTIGQAMRYVSALEEWLRPKLETKKRALNIHACVIGNYIRIEDDTRYLLSQMNNISAVEFQYDLNGIQFYPLEKKMNDNLSLQMPKPSIALWRDIIKMTNSQYNFPNI